MQKRFVRPMLITALLAATHCAAAADYRSWSILCDNVKRCEAVGYGPDAGERWIALRIVREAGPHAPPRATLIMVADEAHAAATVTVDRQKVTGLRFGKQMPVASFKRLLTAMLDATRGQISTGKESWALPVNGMKAALLKMDEVQGRLDTPGALVRRGDRPENTVPPAPPVPTLRAAPKATPLNDAALLAALIAQTDPIQPKLDQHGLYRLHDGRLLLVRQSARGAYQSFYDVWLANARPPYAPRKLSLPMPAGAPSTDIIDYAFDGQTLESYRRPHGAADCGEALAWLWTGQRFELLSAYMADSCAGPAHPIEHRRWIARKAPG